jgi:type II secretory pathway component GspD/PulD (secretin)
MRTRLAAVLAALVLTTAGGAGQPQPPAPAPDDNTPQIAFEVRVLSLPESFFFERAGVDFQAKNAAPAMVRSAALPESGGVLTDAQLKALMDEVQADRRASIVQAPKVTAIDGQEAVVQATQRQTFATGVDATRVNGETVLVPRTTAVELGETFTLCGRVTADQKAVVARVKYTSTRVGKVDMIPVTHKVTPVFEGGSRGVPVPVTQFIQSPQVNTLTVERVDLAIPVGGSAVLPGPTQTRETRMEYGPPVVSKIPYLNRMFKNVGIGRETTRTVLVVTPRVIEVK